MCWTQIYIPVITNDIVGDSLSYSNNMKFSTRDQDNDRLVGRNCATLYTSAGWFNNCAYTNPNRQYTDSEKTGYENIVWMHWKDSPMSLKTMQLMIRPRVWQQNVTSDKEKTYKYMYTVKKLGKSHRENLRTTD